MEITITVLLLSAFALMVIIAARCKSKNVDYAFRIVQLLEEISDYYIQVCKLKEENDMLGKYKTSMPYIVEKKAEVKIVTLEKLVPYISAKQAILDELKLSIPNHLIHSTETRKPYTKDKLITCRIKIVEPLE